MNELKSLRKLIITAVLIVLSVCTSVMWSQTTYWMVRKPANDNKTYYDVQVPSFFVTWLVEKNPTCSWLNTSWAFDTGMRRVSF